MTGVFAGTRLFFLLCLAPLFLALQQAPAKGSGDVTNNEGTIAAVRARHDAEIMAIDGVVTVGTGMDKNGTPCLKIGTSVPPEEVRAKLPEAVLQVCFEIERVGDIEAQ